METDYGFPILQEGDTVCKIACALCIEKSICLSAQSN